MIKLYLQIKNNNNQLNLPKLFVPVSSRTWISNVICHCLFFLFNDLRWEVIVCFFDIGGIVDNHHLNFLFINIEQVWVEIETDWFDLIFVAQRHFQQYFNYIMATSFSGGRSQSIQRESLTMGKQLAKFITCGCESSVAFFVIYKAGREPTPYWW